MDITYIYHWYGIIAVAPNFSILVVGRIISSAAAALIIVKVLAITAMLSAPKNRGKMIDLSIQDLVVPMFLVYQLERLSAI